MIRINQIKLDYRCGREELLAAAAKKLKIKPEEITRLEVVRRSLDCRKGELRTVYCVDVDTAGERALLRRIRHDRDIQVAERSPYRLPDPGAESLSGRPLIIGTGPAGLFCGLLLAQAGYRPMLFERGSEVHERRRKTERFWEEGSLDPQCNVQFGEGGAGTFSDGKLNTRVKDRDGRVSYVLRIFHAAGAPESILYEAKPHVGTDVLTEVVANIREKILSLGGEVFFDSCMTDLRCGASGIEAVQINGQEWVRTDCLVLAIGHSARDTVELLGQRQLNLAAKPFAVGLRIEHPQEMIDRYQYGRPRDEWLPPADYRLTHTCANGRGVYTFCMCPGGYVVNASSERGGIAVNGMSYADRSSPNANSAVVATVTPADFHSDDPLAGITFARALEQAAWQESVRRGSPGAVPVQQFGDFCGGRTTSAFLEVSPVHKGAVVPADLNRCLPPEVCSSLKEGITAFGRKIEGFDRPDALLSGVESRTSSPVRILRDAQFESNIRGIYPCGEGAGYAGGITSAAVDGMRIAEEIIKRFQAPAGAYEAESLRTGSDRI